MFAIYLKLPNRVSRLPLDLKSSLAEGKAVVNAWAKRQRTAVKEKHEPIPEKDWNEEAYEKGDSSEADLLCHAHAEFTAGGVKYTAVIQHVEPAPV